MANTDATFDIILILLVTVLAVAVRLIIRLISQFNDTTKYIVARMHNCSDDEYRHWRRELRCHYLCLLPFVTKKNVAKVYHWLYYKPKYMKKREPRTDGFYHVIAPSLLSICLCAICLCGVSWAWFTSSQSSGVTQIQSARYTVSVTTQAGENEPTPATSDDNGVYQITLEKDKTYDVKITAGGTATTGYCTVKINGTTYHTSPIKNGGIFPFSINAKEEVTIIVTPQWGSCSDISKIISEGYTFTVGTVQESISEEQLENTVTTVPPVSDDENTTNNADTVAPTAPNEETTTPATDTTEQTNPPETTEVTQPTENSSDSNNEETTENNITD